MAKINYAVSGNYGEGYFENEDDAIMAFEMLADYEKLTVAKMDIKWYLDRNGIYEKFPLAIYKTE